MSQVLLADIGGTNARFALADTQLAAPLVTDSIRQFEVAQFSSLAEAAAHYLGEQPLEGRARSAVFAVAGRVDGDQARITNHPWVISRNATARALGLDSLRLVNDFAAQAMAITLLTGADIAVIGDAAWPAAASGSTQATYAVLGPGTGLGVSALVVRGDCRIALETEGGHVSFAAADAGEAAILARLAQRFGRVSNERVVSGGGLVNLHRALSEIAGDAPAELTPRDVTTAASAGDARCQQTVQTFCAMFGAIAGDLVLTLGAWDGVFLTGGLVPRLLTELRDSGFRRRFEDKGRFAAAMAQVPTLAVIHPNAGLLGAAAFALQAAHAPVEAWP